MQATVALWQNKTLLKAPRDPLESILLLTADEAAGRSGEDAAALQTLRVGAGGADAGLQAVKVEPDGQPLQLAVAQEAVAVEEPEDGSGSEASECLRAQAVKGTKRFCAF